MSGQLNFVFVVENQELDVCVENAAVVAHARHAGISAANFLTWSVNTNANATSDGQDAPQDPVPDKYHIPAVHLNQSSLMMMICMT